MAEEYKRKWHEHHDPKADQKEYIGTKILDNIEKSAVEWYQDERTLEGWEYLNPASVATAGAIRTVEGVGTVLANTPIVAQGLQAIGKVEDVAAGTAGSITGSLNLDPRFGGWATRLASAWYGGKVITAASKTRTAQNLSKAAVKFGKIQADEIGMKAHTLLKKKHGKNYTRYKDDPLYPTVDVTDLNRRADLQMNLERSIDYPYSMSPRAVNDLGRAPTIGEMFDIKNILQDQSTELLEQAKNPNISLAKRMELAKTGIGYTATGWYEYPGFREVSGKMTGGGRPYLQSFQTGQTPAGQDRGINIETFKKENLPKLREEYGPALEALKIKGGAQIHHIAAIKATAGIYHKTQYMSPLYREITDTLLEELPGLGDMEGNLLGVVGGSKEVKTPHGIVHKFYKDKIGESGEKFFTDDVLERMTYSKEFRLMKARELAQIIKRSEAIVKQAMENFQLTHSRLIDDVDDLVERLAKFDDDGYLKIDKDYQVSNMNELIKTIKFQDAIDPIIPAVKEIKNPKALDALAIAVEEGLSSVKALRQLEFGKQLEFAIDQITPENLPLIQKARRGTTPGNIASPDYETPSQKGQE